jgi:hypothetical protein
MEATMPDSRMLRVLVGFVLFGLAGAAAASFHLWRINEIYSNADGTVQFVEFREIGGTNGEHFLADQTLTVIGANARHAFTFNDNLPSAATANRHFLVATQGFANLGIMAPDYIIPDDFLIIAGGTIRFGGVDTGPYPVGPVDQVTYGTLPTDGTTSIDRNGAPQTNSPTNFAGTTGLIGALPGPQTGWWWNPAESGRGFFIERRGQNLFFAAYLYADTGRATWTIAAGPMASPTTFQASLLAFTGGQTLTGPYQSPTPAPSLGTLTLSFTDATHGTLTWPGGTVPIQRFDYAGLSAPPIASAPETGWWWNAAESGRGFSLETQGSTIFIAGYLYDVAGNPVWFLSVGALNASGVYQGSWTQFANGQTLGGPYQAPALVNASVGSITLQFTDRQNGILTLPDMRTIPFTRFRF